MLGHFFVAIDEEEPAGEVASFFSMAFVLLQLLLNDFIIIIRDIFINGVNAMG